MKKRMVLVIIALVVVFGGVLGWKAVQNYFIGRYFASFQVPPETVAAATAKLAMLRPHLQAVGSIEAVNGVEVSSEVDGTVERIAFESGQRAQPGELLVQLDASTDRAALEGLLASRKLARLSLRRAESLRRQRLNSQADVDTARTRLEQAEAQLKQTQVAIDKKSIRAPFAGLLGLRQVNLGQYVSAGTAVVSLQSLDPVYVTFTLPEQEFGKIAVDQPVTTTVDSYPKRQFQGRVTALANQVDLQTRNFQVQATLGNPERLLRPGMFAEVQVALPQTHPVVLIPRTAVTYSLYGDFVYVVTGAAPQEGQSRQTPPSGQILKAVQRFVTTGEEHGTDIVITHGLKAGERVVSAGQLKLHNGSAVRVEPGIEPGTEQGATLE